MKTTTNFQILESINAMKTDIAVIKTQNVYQTEALEMLCKKVDLQNSRVNNLERWRAYVVGLGAAAGVILTEIIHGFGRK
jgi:hypothetical protein